ncbi:NUDIX hydrolase N-terminal domain-containing protein [Caviibacterium pharyngocola]|uniref:ADP-ribose pyrophosphatase n=1 Tax=Caviibacterium pharyngocola TaxID=28159 RepID=A0A2M8RX65_9PAST|nr:NUDIX hydrolase [Caviibacterium pharyngocola]PJG83464.1 ADP-ribose pyrophosphatase [Caviibacterium pharyngocola]
MSNQEQWLDWAVELQSLAQAGLFYSKDPFDKERFQRVREIAAAILSERSDIPVEKVTALFCNETGFQTPKLDTRAAIFKQDRILLVQENDGRWSLPGGWVDVDLSIKENTVKEAKEEAGLDVQAEFVIAILDRDKHNLPKMAHKVCKTFVYCTALGGEFTENSETLASDYFPLNELPPLSTEKNTESQIRMCFDAHYAAATWETLFD